MINYKCRMCGGDLSLSEGTEICVCEYCGSKIVIPSLDDDKKKSLFERAYNFLTAKEFDRAEKYFFSITLDYPNEADAFWGVLLCKYGIEYVEEPNTGKRIPTCHRSSFKSLTEDPDYQEVMRCANPNTLPVYKEEADRIEQIRKQIIDIASAEDPYDIFISFKENDEFGSRTIDSLLAEELYNTFTEKGYRVFYSRISLETYVGSEYEPHIFAALNSAKIMLAVGTSPEYYDSVWVKNEWSRFLKLRENDNSKILIACYKGMIAEELPDDFRNVQALDMGKVGSMQDLITVVGKTFRVKDAKAKIGSGHNSELVPKMLQYLSEGKWKEAENYCDMMLDEDHECFEAYAGKLCIEYKVRDKRDLAELKVDFSKDHNYLFAVKYGDSELEVISIKSRYAIASEILENYAGPSKKASIDANLDSYNKLKKAYEIFKRLGSYKDSAERADNCASYMKELEYIDAVTAFDIAKTPDDFMKASERFEKLNGYKSSRRYIEKAEEHSYPNEYANACELLKKSDDISNVHRASVLFGYLGDYKDSKKKREECHNIVIEYEYLGAKQLLESAKDIASAQKAAEIFKSFKDYRDSGKMYQKAQDKITKMNLESRELAFYINKYCDYSHDVKPPKWTTELEAPYRKCTKYKGGILFKLISFMFFITLGALLAWIFGNALWLAIFGEGFLRFFYVIWTVVLAIVTLILLAVYRMMEFYKNCLALLGIFAVTYGLRWLIRDYVDGKECPGIIFLAVFIVFAALFLLYGRIIEKKKEKLSEKYTAAVRNCLKNAASELDALENKYDHILDIEKTREMIFTAIKAHVLPKEEADKTNK